MKQAKRKEAEHQLDVWCRHRDGSQERMIVECKDWKKRTVGQEVLDREVGVRAQIRPYRLAVVTREGFTDGARRVARGEDVALPPTTLTSAAKMSPGWRRPSCPWYA